MYRRSLTLCLLSIVVVVTFGTSVGTAAAPSRSKGAVKQGFVGTNMDPTELLANHVPIDIEVQRAAEAGIEQIRFPVYWGNIQQYPAAKGKAPYYDWKRLDNFVKLASDRGIKLLPTLVGAPAWAKRDLTVSGPSRSKPSVADPNLRIATTSSREIKSNVPSAAHLGEYAAFTKALVARYGTGGSFSTASRNPITVWQVWNEPDHGKFWPQVVNGPCLLTSRKPGAPSGGRVVEVRNPRPGVSKCWYTEEPRVWSYDYLVLLKALRGKAATRVRGVAVPGSGILGANPSAKVMLSSFTSSGALSLRFIYNDINKFFRSTGAKGFFDIAGVNVYPSSARLVDYGIKLRAFRAAMNPKVPLYLTEFSWLSGKCLSTDKSCHKLTDLGSLGGIVVTEAGQAAITPQSLATLAGLAKSMPLEGVFWYTWMTSDRSTDKPWEYAGLNCFDCVFKTIYRTVKGKKTATRVLDTSIKVRRKASYNSFKTKALALEGCKAKSIATACLR